MNGHEATLARQAQLTPRSGASVPAAYAPHPPLQSGGWYRATVRELPGPGRPPVVDGRTNRGVATFLATTELSLLALLLLI